LAAIKGLPLQFLAGEDEVEDGASPGGVGLARGRSEQRQCQRCCGGHGARWGKTLSGFIFVGKGKEGEEQVGADEDEELLRGPEIKRKGRNRLTRLAWRWEPVVVHHGCR
jgi:hypothetical protein